MTIQILEAIRPLNHFLKLYKLDNFDLHDLTCYSVFVYVLLLHEQSFGRTLLTLGTEW